MQEYPQEVIKTPHDREMPKRRPRKVFDDTSIGKTPGAKILLAGVLSCPCPKLGGADGNCVSCNEKEGCDTYKSAVEKGKELFKNSEPPLPS